MPPFKGHTQGLLFVDSRSHVRRPGVGSCWFPEARRCGHLQALPESYQALFPFNVCAALYLQSYAIWGPFQVG